MKIRLAALAVPLLVVACATDSYDPLKDYQEVNAVTILDAPTPTGIAPENRALVARGEYLVELLGCGTCHTDGALLGEPVMSRSLAGSGVGIAYTSPLENRNPGVVFAPNITPDRDTGIGRWTDNEIAAAVKTLAATSAHASWTEYHSVLRDGCAVYPACQRTANGPLLVTAIAVAADRSGGARAWGRCDLRPVPRNAPPGCPG